MADDNKKESTWDKVKGWAKKEYDSARDYAGLGDSSKLDKSRSSSQGASDQAKDRSKKYRKATGSPIGMGSQSGALDDARDEDVPSYKRGGTTRKKGAARLHKGERISKGGRKRRKGRKNGRM